MFVVLLRKRRKKETLIDYTCYSYVMGVWWEQMECVQHQDSSDVCAACPGTWTSGLVGDLAVREGSRVVLLLLVDDAVLGQQQVQEERRDRADRVRSLE